MIVLRIIHIFSGVFWLGTVWFFGLFLFPRVHAAGPEGPRMMQRITAAPLPQVMTTAATLLALTGVLMYWRDSAGFQWAWMRTPTGLALGLGGMFGLSAWLEGLSTSRPAAERMAKLATQVGAGSGPPDPSVVGEMQRLAARLERGVYRSAYLGVIALIGMAIARYL